MKRSRFDSEYDQVRRAAGLGRPEFPEAKEEQLSEDRVAAANADFRMRMNELEKAESALAAEKRVRFDQLRKEYNLRMIRRQYENLKITPPEPLVSLSLLLQLGWRIEEVGIEGRYSLVRPPPYVAPPMPPARPCEMGS
jgi:hypothetical protein